MALATSMWTMQVVCCRGWQVTIPRHLARHQHVDMGARLSSGVMSSTAAQPLPSRSRSAHAANASGIGLLSRIAGKIPPPSRDQVMGIGGFGLL